MERLIRAAVVAGGVLWLVAPAFPRNLSAHDGHKKSSPTPASAEPSEDSPGANDDSSSEAATGQDTAGSAANGAVPAGPRPGSQSRAPVTISARDALMSHLHNKIVHIPLAFGAAGALFLLLTPKWPNYRTAARLLLVLAAVAGVGAFFSGEAQEEAFEHGPLEEYLERHELLGKISAIALAVGAVLSFFRRLEKVMVVYALALLGLLSATGFVGGILAHTTL